MAKAANETEALEHMERCFARNRKLSGQLPTWTQDKVDALEVAELELPEQLLTELGVVDLGVGDQDVMEAWRPAHASYTGVEGCRPIYDAAVKRMASWEGDVEMLNIAFGELTHTESILEICRVPDEGPAIIAALDVLYHIPEDDLYEEVLDFIFGSGALYVVVTHATDTAQRFDSGTAPGEPGFGWFPREWVDPDPDRWECIHSEDASEGVQAQRVLVFRRICE